jgi:hypothetical protein
VPQQSGHDVDKAVVLIGSHTGAGWGQIAQFDSGGTLNADHSGADCLIDEFYIIDHYMSVQLCHLSFVRNHIFPPCASLSAGFYSRILKSLLLVLTKM